MVSRSLILLFHTALVVSGGGTVAVSVLPSIAEIVAQKQPQDAENQRQLAILIEQLKSQNPQDRTEAASLLGRGGAISKPAVPDLLRLVKDPVAEVRMTAIDTLGKLGEEAQLVRLLNDSDPFTRLEVAYGLTLMEKSSDAIVAQMIPLLKDTNPDIRMSAAEILGHTGKVAKDSVPHLLPLLKDANPSIRVKVVYALGRVGELAPLVPLMKDPDANVQSVVRDALGGKGALSAKERMRWRIGDLGSEASSKPPDPFTSTRQALVPQIIPFLKDSDPVVQASAAIILGEMGAIAKSAIPELVPLLKDRDLGVYMSVNAALKKLGYQR